MNLDQELRSTLLAQADTHLPGPDLMTAIRRRERQRRRRQAVVVTALTVAVALAGPVVVSTLRAEPSKVPATVLVSPAPAATFPVTPGWEPDWVGLRWFTYQRTATRAEAALHYEPTFPFTAELTVTVGDGPPTLTGEAVSVGDHAATLASTNGGSTLSWSLPTGWIQVAANDRVSRDELFLYAASLAVHPLPMAMPFALAAIPETAELMSFDRKGIVYRQPRSGAELAISLVPKVTVPTSTSTVDGVALVADRESVTAYHVLDADRAVCVRVAAGWNLDQSHIAAIARGVEVMAVALTTEG